MSITKKIVNILTDPNKLTTIRVIAIPVVIFLLMLPMSRITMSFTTFIFFCASVSDYFDGYFARKRGLVTTFGTIIDPLADKLLVSSTFIMLVSIDLAPAWVVCVIIGREFAITGLRVFIAENNKGDIDLSASSLGKYKVGFQGMSIGFLLIHYPYWGIDFHFIGMFFLWGALIFSVWSGIDYFFKFKKLLNI